MTRIDWVILCSYILAVIDICSRRRFSFETEPGTAVLAWLFRLPAHGGDVSAGAGTAAAGIPVTVLSGKRRRRSSWRVGYWKGRW